MDEASWALVSVGFVMSDTRVDQGESEGVWAGDLMEVTRRDCKGSGRKQRISSWKGG
jgi:hypothetical protein